MVTRNLTDRRVLLHLLKDFSSTHTITSLAKELGLSRVGAWKNLKKLKSNKYLVLKTVGTGKTSASIFTLNWGNLLVEKTLSLYVTEESLKQRRWLVNFAELEKIADFVILYGSILLSPPRAHDIDILSVASQKNFIKIQNAIDQAQKMQAKKIHAINFTESEFRAELQKPNKAFVDALKKGIILFGQENFIKFMKEMAK